MGTLEEGRFESGLVDLDLDLEVESGPKMGGSASESESRSEAAREIEEAVRVLLRGLGEDETREGIKKTPLRVAKALREGTRGYKQRVKDIVQGALFAEAGLENGTGQAGGAGGLVVVRDIDLFSYCESCLLPFRVQCHIGYVPSGQRVVGLSKLSRVADVFAKRLQEPQRLADEICSALQTSIKPAGVAAALLCWHTQFPQKHRSKFDIPGWVQASVCSSSGVFKDSKSSLWNDFSSLLKLRGVNLGGGNTVEPWCPSSSLEVPTTNGRICSKPGSMMAAVSSIILALGEDPRRNELIHTPFRHVQWLMNFKKSNLETKRNGAAIRNDGDRSKIRSELNLPFCSQCEHHLLPFHGVVHVGYFEGEDDEIIERSVLHSLVDFYACKLQVQERLTRQIAESVHSILGRGVMVVVEANHICMISRGIEKVGSSTATVAVMGRFSTDLASKDLFLQSISADASRGW